MTIPAKQIEQLQELSSVCADCQRDTPVRLMALRSAADGQIALACAKCRARALRATRREESALVRRHQAENEILRDLSSQVRKIEVPHISEFCEMLCNALGGAQLVAEYWAQQLLVAAAHRPGSKLVLDGFGAVGKLIAASTQYRSSAPDVATLTDEDLKREMRELVATAITVRRQQEALAVDPTTEVDAGDG